jgi:hypothetical protein
MPCPVPDIKQKADVVAISIGLADQLEPEIRKTLLDAGDQCVDPSRPPPLISGPIYFASAVQFAARISRRRLGVRLFHRSI